jgi:hypothetical protein
LAVNNGAPVHVGVVSLYIACWHAPAETHRGDAAANETRAHALAVLPFDNISAVTANAYVAGPTRYDPNRIAERRTPGDLAKLIVCDATKTSIHTKSPATSIQVTS